MSGIGNVLRFLEFIFNGYFEFLNLLSVKKYKLNKSYGLFFFFILFNIILDNFFTNIIVGDFLESWIIYMYEGNFFMSIKPINFGFRYNKLILT